MRRPTISVDGYVMVPVPGHPRANPQGYVREHLLVAERALGRPVPIAHPVHHVNEDKADNRPANLVICQDNAYHGLLHQRLRALRASGHAGWLRCEICKEYDDPSAMWVSPSKPSRAQHRACHAARQFERTHREAKRSA